MDELEFLDVTHSEVGKFQMGTGSMRFGKNIFDVCFDNRKTNFK